MIKLNIGCGDVYFNGWINIDSVSSKADLTHDVREPLPYDDNFVDFIYNEHFIEHLDINQGELFLKECYRVLKPGGVIRIATPNLRYLMFKYFFFWKNQDWIKKYGFHHIQTKAEMINLCFSEWGHKYLYDKEELKRRLKAAGFINIRKKRIDISKYCELRNLETRKDSKLIIEAIK